MKNLKYILTMNLIPGGILTVTGFFLIIAALLFFDHDSRGFLVPQSAIIGSLVVCSGLLVILCGFWLIYIVDHEHARDIDNPDLKSEPDNPHTVYDFHSTPKYRFGKSLREFNFVFHTDRKLPGAQKHKSWQSLTVGEARKQAEAEAKLVDAYMIVQTGLHTCTVCRKNANGVWNWF